MQCTCLYSIWIDDEAIFEVDEIKVHCTLMHMYLYIDNKFLHAVLNVHVYIHVQYMRHTLNAIY